MERVEVRRCSMWTLVVGLGSQEMYSDARAMRLEVLGEDEKRRVTIWRSIGGARW